MRADEQPLVIAASTETRTAVAARFAGLPDRRKAILGAHLILLPLDDIAESAGAMEVFPSGAGELIAHIRGEQSALSVEVAVVTERPGELLLHGDLIILGRWLLENAAMPVFVTLLTSYIQKRRAKKSGDNDETQVMCELVVDNGDGTSRSIRYKGPASHFAAMMRQQIRGDTAEEDRS